jgi:aryl-alcohol dehydrogenase-like predicted oxidoreductase
MSNPQMIYRELGSTGEQVSAIGLGGWHLSLKHVDEQLATRIVHTAIDRGITFMDNCWDYNGGVSEIRMGKALQGGYRDKVFLMTKVPELTKQNIGILAIKTMASGILLQSKTVTPIECLHYALNLPTSVVITGMDSMEILEQAFEAAQTFQPMNDGQVQTLLDKTAEPGARGEFEPFKTSSIFDGTAQHPDWLGEEPQRLQQLMSAAG